MDASLVILMILAGAVVVALVTGLVVMARGGDSAKAQKAMRWRVGIQLLAVLFLIAWLYASGVR